MRVASLTKDVSEIIDGGPAETRAGDGARIAYHAPCTTQPKNRHASRTLARAGGVCGDARDRSFAVGLPAFTTLSSLRSPTCSKRRQQTLQGMPVEFVATGNIGCQRQLQSRRSFT